MIIHDIADKEFSRYGKIVEGMDVSALLAVLDNVSPCPDDGTVYVPDVPELDALPAYEFLRDHVYGGMPVQIGYCSGTNTKLNCLEYHRGCEINAASSPFVLLLADARSIRDGKIDSAEVEAFRVPADTPVMIYETTLHYAPCGRFKVMVALPAGTNTGKPDIIPSSWEDGLLRARNKWLIAHPDTKEAASGAYAGITGENIDISDIL